MKIPIVKTNLSRLVRFGRFVLPFSIILGTASAYSQASQGSTVGSEAPKCDVPPCSLACLPDFAQWVVTFSYPEEREQNLASSASNPVPSYLKTQTRTIITTKTKDIVHEEVIDIQGDKFEEWHVGSIQYRKTADSKIWLQNEAEINARVANIDYRPLPASGFRDLDWIAKENYAGTLKYAGNNCFVFVLGGKIKLDPANSEDEMKKLESLGKVAFINAESRLPVRVQTNGVVRLYQFADAPTSKLTLPPDLAQQIAQGNEARVMLNQPAARPY